MCEEKERDRRTTRNTLPSPGAAHSKPIQNPHFGNKFTHALFKLSVFSVVVIPSHCCNYYLMLVSDWRRLSFIFTPCSAPIGPAGNISHLGLSFMIGQIQFLYNVPDLDSCRWRQVKQSSLKQKQAESLTW